MAFPETASNPYAPPGAPNGPAPAPFFPPLPEGVRRFRLDPVLLPAFLRSHVLRRIGVFAVLFAMMVPIVSLGSSENIRILAPMFVVVLVFLAFKLLTTVPAMVARELHTFELLVSDRVLRRVVVGMIPAEVLRPEVVRIVETSRGLWVSCLAPPRSLFVPIAIAGYADVRATLAEWRPIEPLGGWAAWSHMNKESRKQGTRDAVVGTALAVDATLGNELAWVRAATGQAWATYPSPPAKGRSRVGLALAAWVILIVMFLAIWQFLSPAEHPRRARPPTPAEEM